jgi:uncharacterized integral membrane protein
MWNRVARLFVIKTRFEAYLIIYALAVGATARAQLYMIQYKGPAGIVLALCCTGAVFLGGAKILDATPKRPRHKRLRKLANRWHGQR